MIEKLEIGSSPTEENCAQVGDVDYSTKALIECQEYKNQLKRHYFTQNKRDLPEGCRLSIRGNNHDFGEYYEVVARFDILDEEAAEAAFWLEANAPEHWDDEAKRVDRLK